MRLPWRKIVMSVGALFVLALAGLLLCQWWVLRAGNSRLYTDVSAIPTRDVGVLLGTSEKLGGGYPNPFFHYRIDAAVDLYKAGKIRHLLVSGDNGTRDYDEPAAMKAALLRSGIPKSAITLDDAGFRTLDSIVRAKKVFGLKQFTIISQRFHDQRALLIAKHYGIDAIGYCAADVELRYSVKTYIRESLARVKAVLDLYVLHTKPKFLGPEVKLPM